MRSVSEIGPETQQARTLRLLLDGQLEFTEYAYLTAHYRAKEAEGEVCGLCGSIIYSAELCGNCAGGNDPFNQSKYNIPRY